MFNLWFGLDNKETGAMFHIIAIVIFYFRSWSEVKLKHQGKN